MVAQPLLQALDEPFPPKEELLVLGTKGSQAAEGTAAIIRRGIFAKRQRMKRDVERLQTVQVDLLQRTFPLASSCLIQRGRFPDALLYRLERLLQRLPADGCPLQKEVLQAGKPQAKIVGVQLAIQGIAEKGACAQPAVEGGHGNIGP